MNENSILEQAKLAGFFFEDAGYSSEGILHTTPLQYSQKCFVRFANIIRKQALEDAARIAEKYFHSTTAKTIRALKEVPSSTSQPKGES